MRPEEHQPHCAAAKRRARLDTGVDLNPRGTHLHALAAEITACCHLLPLKAYRLARGLKVQEAVDALHRSRRDDGLAACKLTREQLTHWENGPTRPGETYRDALCRFHHTGPIQLGWAVDYSPPGTELELPSAIRAFASQTRTAGACLETSAVAGISEEAAVHRRQALRLLMSCSAGPALSPELLSMLERIRAEMDTILGSSTVSDVALDRWETAAEGYGYAFKSRPPLEVLEDVLLDFADLQIHAGRRQPLDSQQRISRVSAQLAGTAANILTDLGHHRSARSWFTTAATAADETRDRALTSWVRAREATVSLYHQRPPQIAITLATEARNRAGDTDCAGAALAAATEARAWARLGHTANALDALNRADTIAGRLRGVDAGNSIYGYPAQQLAFHREAVLTLVGDPHRAVEAQKEALKLYPKAEHINPTLIRLDAAACVIRLGDYDSGYHIALNHLGKTPAQFRTPLVLSRARELADLTVDGKPCRSKNRRDYLEAVDALATTA
ncbi:hypothetical protein ACLQ24_00390 [Micromonospora sp. DT4]|uniref:hypothetical protein n=1 Tax=Micromonospora sp. DT4 TaxID=3393438 RepID=UPI003CF1CBA7